MKHFKLFFILSVFLIYSCSGDENSTSEFQKIEIEKRQYIIEGFQAITACEAGDLTYYFGDCFDGTGYDDAIPASMAAYNDLGLSLNFTPVDNPDDADIVFNCVDDDRWCGTANASPPSLDFPIEAFPNTQTQFPSGGTIGRDINIQVGWAFCPCPEDQLDLCFFMRTVMHEVAHSLGLYHNNILEEDEKNELNPIYVEGTTTDFIDPNSIMNSGLDCTPPCEFNDNDILALSTLYPRIEILGPSYICTNQEYEFCLTNNEEGTWFMENVSPINGQLFGTRPTNCTTHSWDEIGNYVISVDHCGTLITKNIIVAPYCNPPANPPAVFQNICNGDGNTVCHTFTSPSCLQSLDVTSSSPNVIVLGGGTTICLSSTSSVQEDIELTVTANHNCGGPVVWNITANDPNSCN